MLNRMNFGKLSIIIITVMFFAVSGLIVYYATTVNKEVLEATRVKMQEMCTTMGAEIERSFLEGESDLTLIAEHISEANIHYDTAIPYLNFQSQTEEFENLFYVNLDGKAISVTYDEYDFSENETFLYAKNGEFLIAKPHVSVTSDLIVFDIAVPVISNNETVAVLLAEVPIKDLYEILDSTLDNGWTFIVDYDLNIHFTTSLDYIDNKSITFEDIKTLGVQNIEDGTKIAQNGECGSFTYVANYGAGVVQKILSYAPIERSDLILVVVIEEDTINIELETAISQIAKISFLILVFLLLIVIYIWSYRFFTLKALQKVAYYDTLTGLPNLTKLKKDMEYILTHNKDKKYSVIKIDIENFKAVNEMFGFEVGNQVIRAFKTIRETVDEPSLIISRTGTDEFVLFSGNGFLDDMEKRTNIYESYFSKLIPEIKNYKLSFKYGRYHINIGDTNVDEIISKLNLAHRISKENKNIIIFDYDESYTKRILEEAELTTKMNSALLNDEFLVYLQPKFCLHTEKLIGAEALVRWREADGNMIFPNSFIPLFEKNGFIVELDKYILKNVCIIIKKWIDEGLNCIPISINASRLSLKTVDFSSNITEITTEFEVPHEYIEIELTETTTIENEKIVDFLFDDLRKNGFKISIDDFGAGYSSLGLLKDFKVNTLKMDRSFFVGNKETVRGEYVVDGFIKMAHNLDMYVVAEGIETVEQINMLKRINCDAVQGYYYARPMPIEEFEEKYREMMK